MTIYNIPNQTDFQPKSRRELIELSKLSRLPQRKPFHLPDFDNAPMKSVVVTAVCAGCCGRLEPENDFQNTIHGCGKCITIYARIDAAIEEASKRKRKTLLEKMAGGAE